MSGIQHLIVVIQDNGDEAIYFGGDLKFQDNTIYACDIAAVAGDKTIQFSHVVIDACIDPWPKKFEDLLAKYANKIVNAK